MPKVQTFKTFCKCINIVAEEHAVSAICDLGNKAFTIAVVVASGNAIFNSKTSCICAVELWMLTLLQMLLLLLLLQMWLLQQLLLSLRSIGNNKRGRKHVECC